MLASLLLPLQETILLGECVVRDELLLPFPIDCGTGLDVHRRASLTASSPSGALMNQML